MANNTYAKPARLFVTGGGELASAEGTTQGDPLAMPLYALSTVPLIKELHTAHSEILQDWYADDSAGAGRLLELRRWLDMLAERGKVYGYHVNWEKTQLLVKPEFLQEAERIFIGTGIQIVTSGVKYLGSPIGSEEFVNTFVHHAVSQWCGQIDKLSGFAVSEPHAAYSALVHGLRGRWNYLLRTTAIAPESLEQLDIALAGAFLRAITGRSSFTDTELSLLRLPARLGGIGLPSVVEMAREQLEASGRITEGLTTLIRRQEFPDGPDEVDGVLSAVACAKRECRKVARERQAERLRALQSHLSLEVNRRVEELGRPGVSSWLSALPIAEHGFELSKGDFRDAIALRYDWPLRDTPAVCACGAGFSISHALNCAFGGFPTIRHNELRDLFAVALTEVCSSVSVEPPLAPVEGEVFQARLANTSVEARLDVSA